MAPKCIRVYLELDFLFQPKNLNPLRPFQDLPVHFQTPEAKSQMSKKSLDDKSLVNELCDFTKKNALSANLHEKTKTEQKIGKLTVQCGWGEFYCDQTF